jgi:hypothetical protein
MADRLDLSEEARELLRRRVSGEHVEVTDATRGAYRELARAGVMAPASAFLRGPESVFRFTAEGWRHRGELQRPPRRWTPAAIVRRIRRALSPMGKVVSGARSTTSS